MPPLELWGVCLTRNQQGPASAPLGLLPSLRVQIPLPSTYLTSKGTSGSGTSAVSFREEVSPGRALVRMTFTAAVGMCQNAHQLFLFSFLFILGQKIEV